MAKGKNKARQRNILILMEWYDHGIRQGIGQYACRHNWHLTVDESATIPLGWSGDGVLTVFNQREDIISYLQHLRIPVVDMGLYRQDIPLPRVVGDHSRIGTMAAEHFAERGFKHVAWFATTRSPSQLLRMEGFRQGCAALGLGTPLAWLWEEAASDSLHNWQSMRQWLIQLLHQAPKPLAVFTYNDYDASKISDACQAAALTVPEDVAILGVDNNDLICLNQPVPLSSIRHDLRTVGYQGAALLDTLISGTKPPASPLLIPPVEVVLRQSTDQTAINIPAVRHAVQFVKENLANSFGVAEVAQAAGVSRSTLDRLFVQHLGRTMHEEIQRHRLAETKRLLIRSDLTLSEIARQTGFCHAQYLGNLFKKREGTSPRSYCERYTGQSR